MAEISTTINPRYRTIDITSFEYPAVSLDVQFPAVNRGRILPKGKGFSFKLEKPSVSFKTYRAICEHGLKVEADRVLRTRKRSFLTPDAIWAGVLAFASSTNKRTNFSGYAEALRKLEIELNINEKIKPITFEEATEKLPRNTSPGLPYIQTHPGLKKGDILQLYHNSLSYYWHRVGSGDKVVPLPDCAAFARSHITASTENKVRPVWAYPLYAISQEARFASPLIDSIRNQECLEHSAYGMEMLKGGMTWLNNQLHRARKRGATGYLCLDFSAFDASIPAWLIRDVFSIIKKKFIMTDSDDRIFRVLINYFINTPIRNLDGRRFQKDHGIPSGSMFTNIIGTCINFVMMHTILDSKFQLMFLNVFGDDSVAAVKGIININDLQDDFLRIFGVKINVKKSYSTSRIENVHYLGYYNFNGDPIKPTTELLASMLYPQYLKDDWGYTIARALGCALASCGNNPNVFIAARACYIKGARENYENVPHALKLIIENGRMKRHLDVMGCGDWVFNESIFFRNENFFPRLDCTKLQKGILH
uniref:RdRp n=1 Tax=Hubei partiti-like virus 20 TaxID=1923027 RepID=A0A1L3KLL5_9VIRU|nr:RdRp [Hubei partiti-like virus 20]